MYIHIFVFVINYVVECTEPPSDSIDTVPGEHQRTCELVLSLLMIDGRLDSVVDPGGGAKVASPPMAWSVYV